MSQLCSIIIRTYNRAGLVADTVRSALAQDYPHKEIIVVDDGSTDNTRDILAPFAQRGEITWHHQENQGLQGARLAGFALARGEYFIFYDTGDTWDGPGYLAHAISLLERYQAAVAILNFRRRLEPGGSILPGYPEEAGPLHECFAGVSTAELDSPPSPDSARPLTNDQLRALFIDTMPAPSSGLLMRRACTRGAWRGRVRHGDDWMQALSAALEHNASGVLETRRTWTKPITPDSTADGAIGRLAFLTIRIHDRQIMLENFHESLTEAERAIFRRKLLSYELDCTEELLRAARPTDAWEHLQSALRLNPTATFRQLPHLFRAALQSLPKR